MEATTPLWVPILIAAIGVLGTAGSPVLTQLVSQRAERQRREADRADRSAQDVADRTEKWRAERRSTYERIIDHLEVLRYHFLDIRSLIDSGKEPPDDHPVIAEIWATIETLHRSRIWSSRAIIEQTDRFLDRTLTMEAGIIEFAADANHPRAVFDEAHRNYASAVDEILRQVRLELDVPD